MVTSYEEAENLAEKLGLDEVVKSNCGCVASRTEALLALLLRYSKEGTCLWMSNVASMFWCANYGKAAYCIAISFSCDYTGTILDISRHPIFSQINHNWSDQKMTGIINITVVKLDVMHKDRFGLY